MYQTFILMQEIVRQRAEEIERDNRRRVGQGRRRTRG